MNHSVRLAKMEQEVEEYIESLNKDDIFYDIGSCSGYFAIYASNFVKSVYAFEPEPKNYSLSQQNCRYKSNIEVFNLAISDGSKNQVEMRVGQDYGGGHHKTLVTERYCGKENIISENYKKIIVRTDSLDNIVFNKMAPPPTTMKIDVDGSEYDLLLGASETLKNVNSMMIEINYRSPYYNKILTLLENNNFKLHKEFKLKQQNCEGLHNCWYTKCG